VTNPTSPAFGGCYSGKKVWLSGDTGFKGAWMGAWLSALGAEVAGFALESPTQPSLFEQIALADRIRHEHGDVRDAAAVRRSIAAAEPDFVFHFAAQAIVRTSFDQPVETWASNVMGTVHVLDALRCLDKPCAAVLITTDKCYENREWVHAYREEDPLGGFDPYSSSKGAAELAIASWRRSFFARSPVRIASARAGNVIGGGDWAKDRIVPDCIRALQQESPIPVRNKISTRPWQHVLDPLSGYLWLGAVLMESSLRVYNSSLFASAFNFGPGCDSNRTVAELVEEILEHWPGDWKDLSDPAAVHEATRLNLATDKAFHLLGWKSVWGFEKAVAATVDWYHCAANILRSSPQPSARLMELTLATIHDYCMDAGAADLPWAAKNQAA
jgi:CDP-glucose 4,6-dehydratase